MKLLKENFTILILIGLFIVAGIILYSLIPGSVFQSQLENSTKPGNLAPLALLKTDASFDIQEADVRIVKYINSTRVTYEDLQMYPELESYLHGVNNDPGVWHSGWRYVNSFEGNMSRYNALVKKICRGKTIFECNRGTLIEYHDQFYQVSGREYGTLRRTLVGITTLSTPTDDGAMDNGLSNSSFSVNRTGNLSGYNRSPPVPPIATTPQRV
ncbi:hypothetical protein Metfor_2348 [Methanoregula formicica SMSP]|uniref:Uncharacterized protein n=1 Tax=Methanoregula formicica (strain DSM 22288 / NBRC 105244 / SMSP) TaxID=593750 RepID=L0HF40_METFS|nr:hypothetical protein Metfor_2348 [Methanoregula formicica SMSP]